MRITRITPHLMSVPGPLETAYGRKGGSISGHRHWCFVTVETQCGHIGIGEASGWPRVAAEAVRDLSPLLIGTDPRRPEQSWQTLYTAQMGHGITGTVGAGAIAGIDMALWDLKGKAHNAPVYDLLGGRVRDHIKAYAHAGSVEHAKKGQSLGYQAFKTGNPSTAVEKARGIRDALGFGVDLMVDLHGAPWLDSAAAIRVIDALSDCELLFVEEPVAPEDVDGLARLRKSTRVPIAAGERLSTVWGLKRLMDERLVDVIQPDTGRNGITQLKKIANYAEANFIRVAPHAGSLGPVAEFAAAHVMVTLPNALILERFCDDTPERERVASPIPLAAGLITPPDKPGLGVDIDLDAIASLQSSTNVPNSGGPRPYW